MESREEIGHLLNKTPEEINALEVLPSDLAGLIYDQYPIAPVALRQKLPRFFNEQFRSKVRSVMLELVLQRNKGLFDSCVNTLQRLGRGTGKNLFFLPNDATDMAGFRFKHISPLQAAVLRQDPQMFICILKQINFNNPEEAKECETQLSALGPIPTYQSLPECNYNLEQLAQVISDTPENVLEAVLAFNWRKHEAHEAPKCALSDALHAFRTHFSPETFNSTSHEPEDYWFNPKPLIEACNVHNEKCLFWSDNQLRVSWCLVIGYLQDTLPASYRQALRDGLYLVTENRTPLSWDSAAIGESYRTIRGREVDFELGFKYAWYSFSRVMDNPRRGLAFGEPYTACPAAGLEKFCRTNLESLSQIMQPMLPASPDSSPRCSIL